MKKTFLFIFFLTAGLEAFCQTQTFNAAKSKISIQPVQHATFGMSWNDVVVYVDPTGGSAAFKDLKAPELILITDIHGDHFDLKTLEAVNTPGTTIVAPQAVADKLTEPLKKKLVVLNNFMESSYKGISITAIPMYNLPESPDAFHTKGRGNGYLLKIGGKNVYISGDTEDIPEMRNLKNIDIAFVCMNLPYTMDINHAASAVLEFKPKVVIPYHYRGQDVGKFKELVASFDQNIDVRLLKWYDNK